MGFAKRPGIEPGGRGGAGWGGGGAARVAPTSPEPSPGPGCCPRSHGAGRAGRAAQPAPAQVKRLLRQFFRALHDFPSFQVF